MAAAINPFPRLFSPVKVGPLTLKNRVAMASLTTTYAAPDGSVTDRMIEYYAARAAGGAGLIVVEFSFIDNKASRAQTIQLGIYDDVLIPGLNDLAERIKFEGSLAGIQISHCGRQRSLGAYPMVAPSRIPYGAANMVPTELTVEEIREIVRSFQAAARRAVTAGFDYVEIHGCHGYLIAEFLSPYTNRRTDVYGGSLANRMRFPLEVVEAVRSVIPDGVALGFRISAHEYLDGGFTIDEAERAAPELENAGVQVLHVSGGSHDTSHTIIQPMFLPRGFHLPFVARVKERVSIPVIAAGSINRPELAEEVIASGKADLVGLARPLVADPSFPNKAEAGLPETITPCVRCNTCVQRNRQAHRVHCAVNFEAGREFRWKAQPARDAKRVLVVGSGPGGLEAAATLAERGHRVRLCEKDGRLGGRLIEASVPPFKQDLADFMRSLIGRVERSGAEVRLNVEVDAAYASSGEFEAVVVATGAEVTRPAAPLGAAMRVLSTEDASFAPPEGKRVVVVGGGLVGCELAWYLASRGNRVLLTSRRAAAEIAADMERGSRSVVLAELGQHGVELLGGVSLARVLAETVVVMDRDWRETEIPCEVVVLASGFKPRNQLFERLRQLRIDAYAVGDCVRPRRIYDAIHEGAFVGRKV